MSLKNSPNSYGYATKLLHWLVAILVFTQFITIFWREAIKGTDNDALLGPLMTVHKSVGATLMLLGVLFVIWMIANTRPSLPKDMNRALQTFAHSVMHLMLISVLVMAFSGYFRSIAAGYAVDWFGYFNLPSIIEKNDAVRSISVDLHSVFAWILGICIILHILGSLYHHFISKDNVLKRMLP